MIRRLFSTTYTGLQRGSREGSGTGNQGGNNGELHLWNLVLKSEKGNDAREITMTIATRHNSSLNIGTNNASMPKIGQQP